MNDELAVVCYRAMHDLGRRVPEDVALVGCDGIDEIDYLHPAPTTIAQPVAEMCRVAWDYLKKRISDPGGGGNTRCFPRRCGSAGRT